MTRLGSRRFGALAVALVAAAAVTACGGSSSSSTTSSGAANKSAGSSSKAAHGSPIKIGLIATTTGVTAEPWVYQAAQVGAAAANAAGGLMGHPIQIDYCDDQSSTQTAVVCAQKLLVQDHDLMLAGDDGTWDQGVIPILASAHTIMYGTEGASLQAYSSPNVYMFEPEIGDFDEIPQLVPEGQKVADFPADNAIAIHDVQASFPLYYARHDTIKAIGIPLAAADLSPECLQAKNMGATLGVAVFNALTQFAPMAQTCQQLGVNMTWALDGAIISNSVLQAVQKLNIKNLIILPMSQSGINTMVADMHKYGPNISDVYNDAAMMAYMAFKTLPEVVDGAGSLNVSKIQAYLNKQTAFNPMGFTPPVNFTPANHPFGTKFIAVKNTCVYKYVLTNGTPKAVSNTPYCFKP